MEKTVINIKRNKRYRRHRKNRRYRRNTRKIFFRRILLGAIFVFSLLGIFFISWQKSWVWQNVDKDRLKHFASGDSGIEKSRIEKSERMQGNNFIKQNTTTVISGEYVINMEGYNQDTIPTGCESVSAAVVLNYLGIQISPDEFIDRFLPKQEFYMIGEDLYGANPEENFVGNPYVTGSLGCFPPVIIDAVNRLKESGYAQSENITAEELEAVSLEEMCQKYIAKDIPVLVWTTVYMSEPKQGRTYYLEDGTEYTWKSGEHCMVLCGYNESYYYFKDSLSNGETVRYEKNLAERRYYQMGERAMIIMRK